MRNLVALTRRELGVYFVSPLAYIILTAFLAVNGAMFYTIMHGFAQERMPASLEFTQQWLLWILTLLCPLITMRLIAEEKNRGTIETMMTAAVTEPQFVLAKYFAALLFATYLLLPTAFYAAFVAAFSTIDVGATIVGYLGVLLTAGAVIAIGLFISALSSSQVTAGVVTLIVTIGLVSTASFASSLRGVPPWVTDLLNRISLLNNVEPFSQGRIAGAPLAYLLSTIAFFLFVTVRVVESRRWR